MHLPPRRLSICFLHKVNKRYFETLVHSGVASQKRKAGIYFKKWKRFGGRRHISLLVPSLCLENRSRAWDEGGEKGVRKRKGIRCSMILPRLEGSSQRQALLPGSRVGTGKAFLTLGTISFALSCHMFSIRDIFVPSFVVTLGNHSPLEAGVSHRRAGCNFSSLQLAWTIESTF